MYGLPSVEILSEIFGSFYILILENKTNLVKQTPL